MSTSHRSRQKQGTLGYNAFHGIQWKFLREAKPSNKMNRPCSTIMRSTQLEDSPDEIDHLIAVAHKPVSAITYLSGDLQRRHIVQDIFGDIHKLSASVQEQEEQHQLNHSALMKESTVSKPEPVVVSTKEDQNDRELRDRMASPIIFWRPSDRVQLAEDIPRELYSNYRFDDKTHATPLQQQPASLMKSRICGHMPSQKSKQKLRKRHGDAKTSEKSDLNLHHYSTDSTYQQELSSLFISKEYKSYIESEGHRVPHYLHRVKSQRK